MKNDSNGRLAFYLLLLLFFRSGENETWAKQIKKKHVMSFVDGTIGSRVAFDHVIMWSCLIIIEQAIQKNKTITTDCSALEEVKNPHLIDRLAWRDQPFKTCMNDENEPKKKLPNGHRKKKISLMI